MVLKQCPNPYTRVNCLYCGLHVETQEHVLGPCKSPEILQLKYKLYSDITDLLKANIQNSQLHMWLDENIKGIWEGDITKLHHQDRNLQPILGTYDFTNIHALTWNGVHSTNREVM